MGIPAQFLAAQCGKRPGEIASSGVGSGMQVFFNYWARFEMSIGSVVPVTS
jgi:hypothetical protein